MTSDKQQKNFNRREFLQRGAAAAGLAAIGAPAIISAQNANSKIGMAMIGTGSRGCAILRAIKEHPEIQFTGLCDIYPPHLQQGVEQVGNPKIRTWDTWERVVEQKDIDAVIVSTPLFLHVPMSVACLEAGKHVFSEKSMGLTMKQLNQMRDAVAAHPDKTYMVGYQARLGDSLVEAKKLVDDGSIGKVTMFYCHFDRNQTWKRDGVPPEWEHVLNWRLYKDSCGGLLTEVITHEIDQVMAVLGTMPTDATFHGDIQVYKDGREHHDNIMGTWMMEDGVIGVGTGSLTNSAMGMGWSLCGTNGTIECGLDSSQIKVYWETNARHLDSFGVKHKFVTIKLGQSLSATPTPALTPAKIITSDVDSNYDLSTGREFKHFYDCILNGTKPEMDLESARNTSIAALMAYTSSMDGGRKVTRQELEAMG